MKYLAAVFVEEGDLFVADCIRELTSDEFAELSSILSRFNVLQQRLSLLHILEQNYFALDGFISQLRTSDNLNATRALSAVNRHFMNYLSSGYSLREHLTTLLKRDFGHKSKQATLFPQLLEFMEKNYFEYAFFQDFRNYVQHCGFPIGGMNVMQDKNGSTMSLTHTKSTLLKEFSGWKKSDLRKRQEEEFDLLALIKTHHQIVLKEFGAVILGEYGKSIDVVQNYFLKLQNEAKTVRADAEARIITSIDGDPKGGVAFLDIPLNPKIELGLSPGSASDKSHVRLSTVGKQSIRVRLPPRQNNRASKNGISVLSHRTEERDRYFDVRKNDIIGFHPQWENLDFDPFPNAQNDDVVQRAFMGRELVLYAKLEAPFNTVGLHTPLILNGHKFFMDKVSFSFKANAENNLGTFDVEGSEWLTFTEPLKLIAEMRSKLIKEKQNK
jgi:hypothetical protein